MVCQSDGRYMYAVVRGECWELGLEGLAMTVLVRNGVTGPDIFFFPLLVLFEQLRTQSCITVVPSCRTRAHSHGKWLSYSYSKQRRVLPVVSNLARLNTHRFLKS